MSDVCMARQLLCRYLLGAIRASRLASRKEDVLGGSLGGGSNLLRLHLRSANSLSRSLDCCADNSDVMKPGLDAHFTWVLVALDVHDVMLLCS